MNIKDVILGIAIIVLTIFVTYYGINTFFPSPDYNSFCTPEKVNIYVNNSAECEAADGRWNPSYGGPVKATPEGYCDLNWKCSQEFDHANRERSKKVFFIALPLGIIIIAAGAFFFGLEAVGAGLMGGGVGTLIYGSGAYWPYTQNWLRFLLSLIGLSLLIWFAYFWNRKMHEKGKKKR
ncbi:hypothetical protein HY212_01110 [Candidatus Pacearchaeota archaeon]|nr:hypothetical protein [Candidatus Pacearchaeota archaeon]